MSVDLPEPDGPMIAVNSPVHEVDGHPVEGAHLGLALAVDLDQVACARGDSADRGLAEAGRHRRHVPQRAGPAGPSTSGLDPSGP